MLKTAQLGKDCAVNDYITYMRVIELCFYFTI